MSYIIKKEKCSPIHVQLEEHIHPITNRPHSYKVKFFLKNVLRETYIKNFTLKWAESAIAAIRENVK